MQPNNDPIVNQPVNQEQPNLITTASISSQQTPTSDGQVLSSPVSPSDIPIKIDNVNKSVWQYILKRKLWQLIVLTPIVVIWEIIFIILFIKSTSYPKNNPVSGFLGIMIIAPFFIFSGWLYKIKMQFQAAFLEEFALSNNYSFQKNDSIDKTYGSIFRINGIQKVSDVIIGNYSNSLMRLFIHELTTGNGNNRKNYKNTVLEIDLHGQLPNILMSNKHSNLARNLPKVFNYNNSFTTISLEGDFDNYFTLYAPNGNQVEALEIFNPEIMSIMETQASHLSVEFAGNRIYIYMNGFVSTTEGITELFALAKKLINKINPIALRLTTDSAIVPAIVTKVIPSGKISHHSLWPLVIIIILMIIVSFIVFLVLVGANVPK